jgi:hypothetical protein
MHSLALDNNMAVSRIVLSESLELEEWKLITKEFLKKIEVRFGGQTAKSLPDVIGLMARNGFIDFDILDKVKFPHNGFKKAMMYFAKGNLNERAESSIKNYLLGEREGLQLSQLKYHGIRGVKEPLSKRNAEGIFKTVVTFLWKAGLRGTLLLFDENEKTFNWTRGPNPPKSIVDAANLMRRTVDSVSNQGMQGVIFVYTVLPGFVERAYQAYQALGQRLTIPNDGYKQPWRWPVISYASINKYSDRVDFLNAIAIHLNTLTGKCGVQTDITHELLDIGNEVLRRKAGDEYKRDLLKSLTRVCLGHIEGVE